MSRTLLKHACLLAAITAPGLALAEEPAPQAQSLATMEVILEHCAKLIPASADKYREQIKVLAQGASEETLTKIRKSEEYQQSRDSALESLAQVDDESAKKACSQTATPSK
jgi:hypothetical protein